MGLAALNNRAFAPLTRRTLAGLAWVLDKKFGRATYSERSRELLIFGGDGTERERGRAEGILQAIPAIFGVFVVVLVETIIPPTPSGVLALGVVCLYALALLEESRNTEYRIVSEEPPEGAG